MHGPTGGTGASVQDGADGRPTEALSLRELFDLNAYWLAINILWGALGISLLPVLMVDLVCGGDAACTNPLQILPGITVGKGLAEAIIVNLGVLIAILVQPTVAALSDHTSSRLGRRKPYIIIGTLLDMVFLLGFYLAGAWIGILIFYCLLQFSSNFAQGPFQGYMPDLVPAKQVGLASGLMGLMILLGVGGGAMLVAVAQRLGDARYVVFAIMAVELVTMLLTVFRVREGRQGIPREGRSWLQVARGAWGTDILAERSFVWLLGSRLFFLMTSTTLTAVAFFYMQDSFGLSRQGALDMAFLAGALIVAFGALATVPSGRLSERFGRKRMIHFSAVVGAIGMALLVFAPSPGFALAFAVLVGVAAGTFLAVDWALMTDIIPKAESGRYMGISNVVTGSAGAIASAIGLILVDVGNGMFGVGGGPRLAFAVACSYYALGSLLLTQVDEHRREDVAAPLEPVSAVSAG
ncbi:MAG: MFS transporter [Chloroflexota bacterium]